MPNHVPVRREGASAARVTASLTPVLALATALALAFAGCSSTTPPAGSPGTAGPASSAVPSDSGEPHGTGPSATATPLPRPTVGPGATPAPTVAGGFDAETAAALQRVVDLSLKRIPTPGLSVAIRLADGRTWVGVAGARQLEPARPVDPNTVFAVASITKTFVTAAVMQLVSEGKLSLDDTLSRWLPAFPRAGQITVREMLAHTSGIQNYFESVRYNRDVYRNRDRTWTFDEILAFVGGSYCLPGTCFHYSNTNFVLLGRIVELITGKPLADVIKTRFIDPLGLGHTVFQPDQPTPRDAAHGHLYGGGRFFDQSGRGRVIPHLSAVTVAWAAGAMASTASDLALWARELYTGGVVPQDLLAQMLVFRPKDEYGLGTRTRIFNGRRAVGHGGSIRGFENEMWWFPREGASIVLLSNRGIYSPDNTVGMLARTLFSHVPVAPPEYDPGRNTH